MTTCKESMANTIECVCNDTSDIGLMVECTVCRVWFHASKLFRAVGHAISFSRPPHRNYTQPLTKKKEKHKHTQPFTLTHSLTLAYPHSYTRSHTVHTCTLTDRARKCSEAQTMLSTLLPAIECVGFVRRNEIPVHWQCTRCSSAVSMQEHMRQEGCANSKQEILFYQVEFIKKETTSSEWMR